MRKPLWLAIALLSTGCPAFPGELCTDIPGVCNDGSSDGPKSDGGIDAPAGCDLMAEPKDSPKCVDDSVGIFVSTTGKATGAGTKADPVDTLSTALSKLGPKPRIYVCNGNYTDSATVNVPVGVYGGFDCASWSYVMGARPKITGAKPDYALKLDSVSGTVVVTDLELYGKDGAMNSGESSIAVFANACGDVKLVR